METPEMKEAAPFHTGTVPPQWALDFCRIDLEHLRQFHLRFGGLDGTQHPRLAADKLTGQALELARMYPDSDTCRARLWLQAVEGLSVEQRTRLLFPELTGI